ncbi:MAG: hypothetical protein KA066_00745 [Candidatus Pacebacteria bacterium]|nr:hypothetical protein [Candidatus Paceibacterota bacterium]
MNIKYLIPAAALVGFFIMPQAALAICNGVGNSCAYNYDYAAAYTQPNSRTSYQTPYTAYSHQQPQAYQYQQQYQYSPYSQYGYGQGYGTYQQPIYFPVYNTTFPSYIPQQGGYGQGYGYGQQYGGYSSMQGCYGYQYTGSMPCYLGY